MNSRSDDTTQLNARQLLNHLRNLETTDLELMNATFCPSCPPSEPNVFTDGAYKNPQTQRWSLGGFGVWWPGRSTIEHPPNEVEKTFAQCKLEAEGISFWGAITGHRGSSTRTELAAGTVAALSSQAAHQCTDSMAYLGKAQQILDGKCLSLIHI